jgi:hypothetical protein
MKRKSAMRSKFHKLTCPQPLAIFILHAIKISWTGAFYKTFKSYTSISYAFVATHKHYPLDGTTSSGLEFIRILRNALIQYQTNHQRFLSDASLIQHLIV